MWDGAVDSESNTNKSEDIKLPEDGPEAIGKKTKQKWAKPKTT